MNIKLILVFLCLFSIKTYSQSENANYSITVEHEIEDFYPTFYNADNIYTPISSYKDNVYFIYVDSSYRPVVGQIKNGEVSTFFLDNEEPTYTVQLDPSTGVPDGHNKYSIGIDKEGYIHIVGDLHNYGASASYVYHERYTDKYNMYWVSKNPEDMSEFEFVGGDIERVMPGNGFSYPVFHNDMNGELYIRHRARLGNGGHYEGEMGWIAARYNVDTKQWTELGGKTPADFQGYAENEGSVRFEAIYKAIIWEDNGFYGSVGKSFYQGFPGHMQFDFNNRWHIASLINNDSEKSFSTDLLYAYSDDGGISFNKAGGTPINELPIRAEEGPNQGSIVADLSESEDGYFLVPSVSFDKEGVPLITYTKFVSDSTYGYSDGLYKYWDQENNTWSAEIENPTRGFIRHMNLLDANGMMNYLEGSKIIREFGLTPSLKTQSDIEYTGVFFAPDTRGVREKNVLRGFLSSSAEGTLKIVRIESEIELSPISDKWATTLLGDATSEENGMFNDIFQIKSTGTFDENFSGEYIHQTIEGDFELEARVLNVNYVSDASYAGLMIKDGNEENSSLFGVAVTSHEGVKTIAKNLDEFSMTQTEGYEPSEWLKITKNGNLFEAYRSDNGENWMKVDSEEIEMADIVSYGLVAGSGNSHENSHARIDHVSITKDSALTTEEANSIFSIYPNPTENIINITYSNFVGDEDLQITDLNGRLLLNKKLEGINSIIDVSSLASNIYFIKITNTKREEERKKILIK